MKTILEKYIPFETSDGKVVFVENYNKSHDPSSGRFTSGAGGSKANKSLDENLGTIAKFMSTNYKGTKDLKYTSSEDMVMKLGSNFKPAPKPKDIKQGEVKACYKNATDLAVSTNYTYVEGYATPDNIDLPIAHAWVVDKKGTVIDNTWKTPGSAYKGIPLKTEFLLETVSNKGVYGVIVGADMNPYLKSGLPKEAIADIKSNNDYHNYHPVEAIQNKLDNESQGLIQTQQGSLQNSIMNLEARVIQAIMKNIFKTKNNFNNNDLLTKDEEESFKKELAIILAGYYGIIIPLFGRSTVNRRAQEFNKFTNFTLNDDIKRYIKNIAKKASTSHIQTTLNDVLDVVNETYNKSVQSQLEVIKKTRKVTDADLVLARKKALEGASQYDITNAIKKEFNETISKVRAKTIARTETNRAFTQSQFQADLQFIKQANLEGRAYKKWITRSDNPCAICLKLASQPPIPFKTNFADIGDELTGIFTNDKGITRVIKQVVSFEDLAAGNAHVNCACVYQLIIEGYSENSFDKEQNYNKNHDPGSGRFTSGGGSYEKINKDKIDDYISKQSVVGTEDDKSSLAYLIGGYSSHRTINSYYREGRFAGNIDKSKWMVNKFQNGKYEESTIGEITPKLDSLFAKNKVKSGIVVYRTMTLTKKESSRLTKGVVFKDLGYTSTTLDKEYANTFDKGISEIGKNQQRIVATIKVPKNTSGLFPSNVISGISHERELTLNRSTSFKVIDNKTTDDTLNLELEVVNE